jgi:hypothetical protein
MFLPPEIEQGDDRLPGRVAQLGLAHPGDRVATAEGDERVAHPRAPLVLAPERSAPLNAEAEATIAPDRQQPDQ